MKTKIVITPLFLFAVCICSNIFFMVFFYLDQNTSRLDQLSRIVSTLIRENVKHYDKISLKVNLNEVRNSNPEIEYACILLPDNSIVYAGSPLSLERAQNIEACRSTKSVRGMRTFSANIGEDSQYSLKLRVRHDFRQLFSTLLNPFVIMANLLSLILYFVGARYLSRLAKDARNETLLTLSRQVAHDIRSPLSALNMVTSSLREIPEDKRLIIRNATQRINDIANNLLQRGTSHAAESPERSLANPNSPSPVLLSALLDSVVSEKRAQFRDRLDVDLRADLDAGYGLFVFARHSELARVVSNLLNNAVEACDKGGQITVRLDGNQNDIYVRIFDTGRGIPPEILSRVGEKGLSFGKSSPASGSGLGLYHAKLTVEALGGSLKVDSIVTRGTSVVLTLPRTATPTWFVEALNLSPNALVVSVDDDQTIHQIWQGRLASSGASKHQIEQMTFSSLTNFEQWVTTDIIPNCIFLVDYEFLGSQLSGLDVIERSRICSRAILVTSRYEEPHVRERADRLGGRIIPKALAPQVPIVIGVPDTVADAIVIDDDPLVHMTWQIAANQQGKVVHTFLGLEEFLPAEGQFERNSPVFVDVNLANGARGEDVARTLHQLGFTNIILATGFSPDAICAPPCVSKVVGKDPRF